MSNIYNKIFASRAVLSFFMVMLLLLTCILRVAVISTGNYSQIQALQTAYKIEVARLRGTIYDCNMIPITNANTTTVAAIAPTPKGIMAISSLLEGDELEAVLDSLKKDIPAICAVSNPIENEGIATTTVYDHIGEYLPACHIIGYTDSTGHGVTGLELAYDDILYSDKKVTAVFSANGRGDILRGIDPYFENDLSVVANGVVTTIDINIQNIVEDIASKMNSGCILVSEVSNGKIRAMASVPDFDVNNIAASLDADNSPMLNRALYTYNVGSVFKPCVAAAIIESGYNGYTFDCEGKVKIADRDFRCHKLSGHGTVNLQIALAQSCNCFFYDFSTTHNKENLYKFACSLSLNNKLNIADNLYASSGNIPELNTLKNDGVAANFSIGQGNLLASPVAILNLYTAIAGDGSYYLPSIVEKTIKNGKEEQYDKGNKTRVMKNETAAILREYLQTVISDGTGIEAQPKLCTAAGKTATAQTGRYYDTGEEITNSWFCGFFPAEEPRYAVVVMSDSKLNVSTASVFAEIADKICELYDEIIKNDS